MVQVFALHGTVLNFDWVPFAMLLSGGGNEFAGMLAIAAALFIASWKLPLNGTIGSLVEPKPTENGPALTPTDAETKNSM